jgi:Putative restriction endonuclease
MSKITQPDAESGPLPPALPPVPVFRFTVAQYHAMAKAGILTPDDKVELLAGWIVPKMTKNPPHSCATQLTRRALERVLPDGWHVAPQEPVTTDDSEPEPDVGVVRGDIRDYAERHPGAADIGMLVEVADSSVSRDGGIKKWIYADARIPIYWIVNIPQRQVEVYTQPTGTGEHASYAQRQDHGIDDQVPVMLDGREVGRIAVRDLLP